MTGTKLDAVMTERCSGQLQKAQSFGNAFENPNSSQSYNKSEMFPFRNWKPFSLTTLMMSGQRREKLSTGYNSLMEEHYLQTGRKHALESEPRQRSFFTENECRRRCRRRH
jgi:hypothetical protein